MQLSYVVYFLALIHLPEALSITEYGKVAQTRSQETQSQVLQICEIEQITSLFWVLISSYVKLKGWCRSF